MAQKFTHLTSIRQKIIETGVGLGGLEGAWWLLAQAPFVLPAYVEKQLADMAPAVFLFLDTVGALYASGANSESKLAQLLQHKVPATLLHSAPRTWGTRPVLGLRPDFQLHPVDGRIQLVATELEIAPSAHGFAHAMQIGYGLKTDLVEQVAHFLNGRTLIFVGTEQWSEFLLEQLAFCRALAQVGARAFVLYDKPIRAMAAEVMAGQRWQPPMFGIPHKTADWQADIWGRITRRGLAPFIFPNDQKWPPEVGDAVLFRFGYGVNFSAAHLATFTRWHQQGATLLNPPTFYLDSKVLLCAMQLPAVRSQIAAISPAALALLDRAIPETHLLGADEPPNMGQKVQRERTQWIIKLAGFDTGDLAWGGRSVQIGAQHTDADWATIVQHAQELPWPVVAQRMTPSRQIDMPYVGLSGRPAVLKNGVTRLRSFLLRHADGSVSVGGNHLTVSARQQVSEGVDSVQAPVIFEGK